MYPVSISRTYPFTDINRRQRLSVFAAHLQVRLRNRGATQKHSWRTRTRISLVRYAISSRLL